MKIELHEVPPNYTDDDAKQRDMLLRDLGTLQQQYQEAARPIIDRLAQIEAKYPRRHVIYQSRGAL